MVKHQPLQVYERQLCLSCITGIYGCRWKRYQRSHDDTTKWELLWSLILLLTFCLLLVWCYFWWEAHNDYNEFNWFLYNRSGEWSDGTVPILATTAAGFTYIAFLMILALCHVALGQQLNLHWLHKVGVSVALLTTVAGVISINQTWGQEWDIIPISLQATGPFLHIGALAAVTALSWIVAGQVARAEKTMFQVVVMLLYLSLLLGLYVMPLYITSPCIMEHASLKPRPDVIGLRGASMLAPENTLWSFQRALQMNVTGLEADVAISVDGVPFLMHDRTLRRTTDIGKVFPERKTDEAALFNWTDLQQLNAGQWFLKDDPFWTVHMLSPHEKTLIANQSVCSLKQLLNLSSYHNSTVVFRLRRPPLEHPFHHSWINDTLHVVQQSGVPQNLVMWTPDEHRAQVRELAPGLIQTSVEKQSPQSLNQSGISRLLLRYNQASAWEISNFSKSHINLTLYTVNEPWLFSVLWCSGVSSVSSEAPHILKKVLYPIGHMRPQDYCLMWVTADLISFAVVVGIFIFQKFARLSPVQRELLLASKLTSLVSRPFFVLPPLLPLPLPDVHALLLLCCILASSLSYHMIRYRMSGMRSYNPEQIMLSAAVRRSSRDISVMKEKLIFSEVGNGVGSAEELYVDNDCDYYTNQGISQ